MFRTDKALSNPKFEGYKLRIIPQEECLLQFPLANLPTQAATSGKIPLAFQEVQSRITHNHLAVHNESGRALYVDADQNVILVELGQDRLSPTVRQVYELPKSIQSDAVDLGVHREYPSAAFVSSTLLLVSGGQGTMYILGLDESTQLGEATLLGKFTLPSGGPGAADLPFRIHHAHGPSPSRLIATLSSRHYPATYREEQHGKRTPVEFDIWGVKVNFMDMVALDNPEPVEILWHRRGEDVPFYTTYSHLHQLYLLVGGSEYHRPETPPLTKYEPSPEEIVHAPQTGTGSVPPNAPSEPPPYSWTQSSDTITMAIPLPSDTPKDRIKVLFSSTTLTFHVDWESSLPASQSISIPRYSARKLWDGISPSSSFWTFDREAEHTFGILSLHLEKQHEDTRWSHVFASAGTDSQAEEDADVPETMDPSELWNIREALEKYTAALQGDDISGQGFGKGIPSLAENEMDEEVDSSVGRTAYMTWIPDPSLQMAHDHPLFKEFATPVQLLSTPLPGQVADGASLIIKDDIDGTVFSLDDAPVASSIPLNWKHTATYPALAFVLASKRDVRFTYHVPGKAVFAFEGGSSGGNIYVYYPTASKATTAKQSILKIDGGALMGVGSFTDSSGNPIVACLSEGMLTLIKGV